MNSFDYIIIGAGSAGCVLANRLSADPNTTVLLLEAGGSDKSMLIQMPAALSMPMNMPKYSWGFYSEPEPHLNNRRMHCPRGKVLGGCSSINGMAYVRGNPMDYDNWEALGAKGWGYQDVLPYFKKAETFVQPGPYRGDSGPLKVKRGYLKNPLYHAFIKAGVQAGYPHTQDMNGYQQEGFGFMDMTIAKHVRASASNMYLKPIKHRKNLKIWAKSHVDKILFKDKQAMGVQFKKFGKSFNVYARKEIILSAGAIGSPHILMCSGIGPADQLGPQNIPMIYDAPEVGQNLMDHLELYIQYACKKPITLYGSMKLFHKAWIGTQWLLHQEGLGSSNHFESGGFIRSHAGVQWPNLQYHFLPLAISYDGSALAKGHGFQAHVGPMRSKSRGHVMLRTASTEDKPKVVFNYMSHEQDWEEMRAAVRLTREVFQQKAFDPFRGKELAPGKKIQLDHELDDYIQDRVESAYHPCGTCRMGDDPKSVVDTQCRVRGVKHLRVVDASIMPQITTGNLNAPTIMMAERAADMLLKKTLMKSDLTYYRAPSWQTKQRDKVEERA